jgi:hypothetical protein
VNHGIRNVLREQQLERLDLALGRLPDVLADMGDAGTPVLAPPLLTTEPVSQS